LAARTDEAETVGVDTLIESEVFSRVITTAHPLLAEGRYL